MSSLMDPLRHRAPTPPDSQYTGSFGAPMTNGGSTNGSVHTNGPSAANGNGAANGTRKTSPGGESATTFVYSGGNNGGNAASGGAAAASRVPCINCGTLETPLWRRTPEGNPICNACGLYQKSRNMPRPASLSPTTSAHPAHPHTVASLAASASASAAGPNPPPAPSSTNANPPATHPAAYAASHSSAAHGNNNNNNSAAGGTCPGDGRCDGTGGTSACSGCPTWNNSASRASANAAAGSGHPPSGASSGNNQGSPQSQSTSGGGAGGGGIQGGQGQPEEPASMRQILNPTPPPGSTSQGGSPRPYRNS
ncbi:hypothetical protein C8F04DRAFT_1036622, partial [Mycena alexandri]